MIKRFYAETEANGNDWSWAVQTLSRLLFRRRHFSDPFRSNYDLVLLQFVLYLFMRIQFCPSTLWYVWLMGRTGDWREIGVPICIRPATRPIIRQQLYKTQLNNAIVESLNRGGGGIKRSTNMKTVATGSSKIKYENHFIILMLQSCL